MEIWKDIKGYEGIYKISNYGNVKSLNFNRTNKEKLLKNRIVNEGYVQVVLYKNSKRKAYYVHCLVANHFIENPNNLPEVNHKDGNKQNNNVDNLEWVTSKENSIHEIKNNLKVIQHRINNPMSKKIIQKNTKHEIIKIWDSMNDIKRDLGLNISNIHKCCNNQIKTAYGFIWDYYNREELSNE